MHGRALVAAAVSAALLATAVVLPGTAAAATTATVVVPYKATWQYQQAPHGRGRAFYQPTYDAGGFATGQAGFGVKNGTCVFNNPSRVNTYWAPNTDLLLRKEFDVPGAPVSAHLSGTIDNDAFVYLNGTLLTVVKDGFCGIGGIDLDVPVADLLPTGNLLAVRGIDTGGASFVDVQLVVRG